MTIAIATTSFTLQVESPYNGSMLELEETLQQRLNEAGFVATTDGLEQFDTDGLPITVGPVKLTTKGRVERITRPATAWPPWPATSTRARGGPTYCPLDRDARFVVSSTPRFAKIVSHKYAEFSSPGSRWT